MMLQGQEAMVRSSLPHNIAYMHEESVTNMQISDLRGRLSQCSVAQRINWNWFIIRAAIAVTGVHCKIQFA